MEANEKVITSLFKVVLLCEKQGIACHGHQDDCLNWEDANEDSSSNQGNFIEFVHFRAETNEVLSRHLLKSPCKAHYSSKTIQNELIEVVGNQLHKDIIDEVIISKLYTLIADKVTDISNKQQSLVFTMYMVLKSRNCLSATSQSRGLLGSH